MQSTVYIFLTSGYATALSVNDYENVSTLDHLVSIESAVLQTHELSAPKPPSVEAE